MQQARVRINGFDFDSTSPVQGNVIDEKYEQAKKDFIHGAIGYIIAMDVVALGAWACQWWYYGGWKWLVMLFFKHASRLMHMVSVGTT